MPGLIVLVADAFQLLDLTVKQSYHLVGKHFASMKSVSKLVGTEWEVLEVVQLEPESTHHGSHTHQVQLEAQVHIFVTHSCELSNSL